MSQFSAPPVAKLRHIILIFLNTCELSPGVIYECNRAVKLLLYSELESRAIKLIFKSFGNEPWLLN